MMTCKEVLQRLSDIVDKEAPLMTRWSFYLHIAMCRNCRAYFRQFKQVREASIQIDVGDFSEDFFRVMEETLADLPENGTSSPTPTPKQ